MPIVRLAATICGVAATLAAAGCGKGEYEVAPAQGVVTVDGKPFGAGKVMFAPVAKGDDRRAGRASFGKLDAEGRFRLGAYADDDGAVVGDHWATLIRLPDNESAAPAPAGLPPFERVAFPQRLTVTADGENMFALDFTREMIALHGRKPE